MVVSGPLTPGQVSFLLGIIPIFVSWIYSEWLEYKKSSSPSKLHSDNSLVELQTEAIKEDDRAVLLEGGLTKSASMRQPAASIKANLIRFVTMEESFLIENRATLRAMSEFGGILFYFYICDRTNLIPESTKSYNRDLLMFLYALLIIVSAMTSLKKHSDKSAFSGKSILYLNRHQTEEWKGWMQVLFLMYHYFAATEIYNAIRVFIAAYVWMTGFGNFSYYYIRKHFSVARFSQANCCFIPILRFLPSPHLPFHLHNHHLLTRFFTLLRSIPLHKKTSTSPFPPSEKLKPIYFGSLVTVVPVSIFHQKIHDRFPSEESSDMYGRDRSVYQLAGTPKAIRK